MNRRRITKIFFICIGIILSTTYMYCFSSVDSLMDETARRKQIIAPHDLLDIKIYPQKELDRETYVDENGFLFFDFLGHIKVAGLTVGEAENRLSELLEKDYLKNPTVVIRVKESSKNVIVIIGEVKDPGTYDYTAGGMTLMGAVSKANGFTNIAWINKTKIVRVQDDGKELSFTVKVKDIIEGKQKDVLLQPGDIIVVPESIF